MMAHLPNKKKNWKKIKHISKMISKKEINHTTHWVLLNFKILVRVLRKTNVVFGKIWLKDMKISESGWTID